MRTRKSGPLHGLRVVILPWQMTAKITGMVMADNGATVVELFDSKIDVEPHWELAEQVWHRGKDMLALESGEQLARMISEADIFVTDYNTAQLKALDADLERLHVKHPALVILQISGYGRDSVRANEGWTEALAWANLGFFYRQPGYREGPKMPTFPAGSCATVFNGITAALAAIHARNETGSGQIVDSSISDGLAAQQTMLWYWTEQNKASNVSIDIRGGGMGRLVLEAYQCADGEWLHIHTGSKGAFSRLMALAGLQDQVPPIPTEAASELGQPIEKWQLELIHATLPAMFFSKTRDEWRQIFREQDIAAMPDLLGGEVFRDPQAIENQLSTLVDLPSGETVRAAGAVLKFSDTPAFPAGTAERKVTTEEALADLKQAVIRVEPPKRGSGNLKDKWPLKGLKVVDFGVHFAGPFASRLMADLGADVIKLENLFGCPLRPISQGRFFNAANHHKRTLAMNLKKPEARPVIEKLVAWADVIHHNLRPGVAEELELGYEDLRDKNPRLIYCHSPAFGSIGPYKELPGFEPLSSAITGLMMRHGDCHDVGPYSAIGSMDPGNGMLGAAGIMMALYNRDRTGKGQYIECPQMGSAMLSTPETVIRRDGSILDPLRVDAEQYGFSWWKRLYQAEEGWFVVDAWSAKAREGLLQVTSAKEDNAIDAISAWAAKRPAADAVEKLRAAGVPVEAIGAAYRGDNYFFDDENLRLGRVIVYSDVPKWGSYRDLGQFWRFSESPLRKPEEGGLAPGIGVNTRDILHEHGFSDAEIATLIEKRVVGASESV